MAHELPAERQEAWSQPPATPGSILDRTFTLSVSTGRWIAIVLTLVAAVLLRILGLDRWALSAAEGEIALAARNLVLGNDLPADLLGRPFVVEWTSLFMFLGDTTETVARMSVAVAGIAVVVLTLLSKRFFGALPALSAAILLTLSPTMVANSRRVDGGMLIVMLALALVFAVLMARDRQSVVWPALGGAAVAAMFLSGPLGVVALVLLAIAGVVMSRGATRAQGVSWLIPAGSFLVTYALLSTTFLTRPAGVWRAPVETFRQLFNDHLEAAGDRFHVPLFNLIVNEPLLIALALVGVAAPQRRNVTLPLGLATIVVLIVVSALGDTGLAGHALVVLPLAILAGFGAAQIVERIPWQAVRSGRAALYVAGIILVVLAFASIVGLLTPDAGLSGWTWIFQLLTIVVLVILPLTIALSFIGRRIDGHRLVLVLTAALVMLSLLTVRSAVLAASERPGEPMDPLAAGTTAPSLSAVVDRVHRLSIDMTRTDRSPRDPTGGHGLHVAIDEEIEHPLHWYFREFPNLSVIDPVNDGIPQDTQVAFLSADRNAAELAPAMAAETYLLGHESPDLYADPDWSRLLQGIFRIGELRNFWGFMIERTEPPEDTRQDFQLLLTPALAERLFGPQGPFDLDDMAGAGTEGGQFNNPRGIAVADDGTVYVVDAGNQRIQVFNPAGEFAFTFGSNGTQPGQFGSFGSGQGGPGGIAVTEDRVFVADTWNHRIQVFSREGDFIVEWGDFFDAQDDPAEVDVRPGAFYGPRGIAVYEDRVYVADTGNERVQVFDLDGDYQLSIGGYGSEVGQLLEPVGIAIADDTVYVADSHNSRISRFTLDGEPLDPWSVATWSELRFFEPYLAVTLDGRIVATTSLSNEVLVFDDNGDYTTLQTTDDLLQPYGIAIRPDSGTGLVTDGVRNAVVTIDVLPR